MRLPAVIIGFSFAVICTSLAATRQADPLAEQQFKNIVSFKGKKASELIPAMEFMNASLKVQCSYCHAADRSSDEKAKKKTAREMIAMQKDINDKNFNGQNVITCATCHAGKTHPTPVPPITGLEVRSRRSSDVMPDQVLSAYAKALVSDATPAGGSFKLTGTTTSQGETAPVEATYSGDKFYILAHRAKGDQKQGFNGSTAWFTGPQGVQTVPLQYAEQYVRESTIFLTPESLPKLDSPSGGTSKIDGRDAVVVNGLLAGTKSRVSYFFDKETGLLARTTFFYPTILGSIEQINDYSNYRKVGGVQVPMKIVNHSAEGDSVQEFTSATAEPKGDATLFDPPKQ